MSHDPQYKKFMILVSCLAVLPSIRSPITKQTKRAKELRQAISQRETIHPTLVDALFLSSFIFFLRKNKLCVCRGCSGTLSLMSRVCFYLYLFNVFFFVSVYFISFFFRLQFVIFNAESFCMILLLSFSIWCSRD